MNKVRSKKALRLSDVKICYTQERWKIIKEKIIDLYIKNQDNKITLQNFPQDILESINSSQLRSRLEKIVERFVFDYNSKKIIFLGDLTKSINRLEKICYQLEYCIKINGKPLATLLDVASEDFAEKQLGIHQSIENMKLIFDAAKSIVADPNPFIIAKFENVGMISHAQQPLSKKGAYGQLAANVLQYLGNSVGWSTKRPNASIYKWDEKDSPLLDFIKTLIPRDGEISHELIPKPIGNKKLKDYILYYVQQEEYGLDDNSVPQIYQGLV